MGHLMMRTMEKVLEALQRLTLEEDGVDGSRIQQYAEAWSFGEVILRARMQFVLNLTPSVGAL